MTGPEHYREAERLLELGAPDAELRAQVHATLAQVAATMDVAGATVNGVVATGWAAAIT